ncbi:hypothetical protein [Vibrio diabolicus]|uniref:hypothetical protein n=1 Tax=Vibrio diabolicus TaxID=50719 RepID=UPI00062BF5B3|nr:hypothetical protein [Vibrio diabolicus]
MIISFLMPCLTNKFSALNRKCITSGLVQESHHHFLNLLIHQLFSTIASRKKKAKAPKRTKWREKKKTEIKWQALSGYWQLAPEKPKSWQKVAIFIGG